MASVLRARQEIHGLTHPYPVLTHHYPVLTQHDPVRVQALSKLRRLQLSQHDLGMLSGAPPLWPPLAALTELRVSFMTPGRRAVAPAAPLATATALRRLGLECVDLPEASFAALPPPAHLTALELVHARVYGDALPQFLRAATALAKLCLIENGLPPAAAAAALAALPPALAHLHVRGNGVGVAGAAALAAAPLPGLAHISLPHCGLTSAALEALSGALPLWPQLTQLDLSGNCLLYTSPSPRD